MDWIKFIGALVVFIGVVLFLVWAIEQATIVFFRTAGKSWREGVLEAESEGRRKRGAR